jgi:hypothetical protein
MTVFMKAVALLLLALATGTAHAEAWIVHGQTRLDASRSGVDNPAPNTAGALGEVTELPYQVPSGRRLVITAYGFEGHTRPEKTVPVYVILVWLSDHPMPDAMPEDRAPRSLFSCAASIQSNVCPVHFIVPAGKWVNVRILNDGSNMRHAWFVTGELVPE